MDALYANTTGYETLQFGNRYHILQLSSNVNTAIGSELNVLEQITWYYNSDWWNYNCIGQNSSGGGILGHATMVIISTWWRGVLLVTNIMECNWRFIFHFRFGYGVI